MILDKEKYVKVNGYVYYAWLVKARKPHTCRLCGRVIEKGEYYYRFGIFKSRCLCVECAEKNEAENISITEELIIGVDE